MCYPKPGPRCPSSARASIKVAERAMARADTDEGRLSAHDAVVQAWSAYDMTIEGMNKLSHAAVVAASRGDESRADGYKRRLDRARDNRKLSLAKIGLMVDKGDQEDATHDENSQKQLRPKTEPLRFTEKNAATRTKTVLAHFPAAEESLSTPQGWEDHLNIIAALPAENYQSQSVLRIQQRDITDLRTYSEWQSAGKVIKPQTKAIYRLTPSRNSDGSTSYRSEAVYDAAQLENGENNKKLREWKRTDARPFHERVAALSARFNFTVKESDDIPEGKNAVSNLMDRTITIRKGLNEKSASRAVVGEIAHLALGHHKTVPVDDVDAQTRTMEASSLAYAVLKSNGYQIAEGAFANSRSVASWLRRSGETIPLSASRVSTAARWIHNALNS